ncbi:Phage protein [Yersinia phage fHe-Yen9-04]|uniref:Phage protein n=2 Tax=Eneladusvirus Yen904 TaxID=2560849 RepID=A0A2C9CX38_9CAUD|nr:Phage protein [Yersinia phage fHe-Yen9-04]SOK58380.1 Phage protein [Yersinia phage fHe-Yen9-04]SOK58915.1 Phage protein [Yersinia phage fHe-Yen9-03]VUE36149.1 Phage protein [Yersinia phage fHe-Yen9-04]
MKADQYLNEYQKSLYSGAWVDSHPASDKMVTCIRCFNSYNLKLAPRTVPKTDGYYTKEPKCPTCGCRLYFSQ